MLGLVRHADADAPVTLFDGKSMAGWHQAGPGSFDIQDGALCGHGGMGLLWNDHPFSDFELKCQFKVGKPSDNSGVFVRFPDPGNDPWVAVNQGHEVQICDTEKGHQTGAIYNFQNCSSLNSKPVGEWNDYDIKVVGHHYLITLNGKLVNDFTTSRPLLQGYIGLQNHWGNVAFRNITVTPIDGGAESVATVPPVTLVEPAPGMVGTYFDNEQRLRDPKRMDRKPFFMRVDPQVNFPPVSEDFYGSHMGELFTVHWQGAIHIEKPGVYAFALQSDDGSRLTVGDHRVINFTARHQSMDVMAGEVRFEKAGDYPLLVEFHNDSAEAGCILSWQLPGVDHMATVPASVLLHDKSAEKVTWDKSAWELYSRDPRAYVKAHGKPYEKMDYGPFLAGSFEAPLPAGNVTDKGIIVSLDNDRDTNILFDTETLRYSAGWTGGLINYHSVAYDGAHGSVPAIKGKQVFGTAVGPGWEVDGSFADKRKNGFGNIPGLHYRGLYRHGQQTVLSYEVNGVGILDFASGAVNKGDAVFTRTMAIDPSRSPLKLLVASTLDKSVLITASGDVKIDSDSHGATFATIPPHEATTQYAITISQGQHAVRSTATEPKLAELIQSNPAIWGDPVVTHGKLGTNDGPYTVDTITAPDQNPSDAWLRFGGFDFFPDGKSAAISTWNGDVWIVKGIDGNLDHLTWQRYATGLFQALGVKIVDGDVYVLGRDQITHLHDTNGDGEADFYENFNNDCEVSSGFHEFAHDLQRDSQGNFYYAKGGPVNSGGRGFSQLTDNAGCIMKVSPDGKHSEVYATGLRAPNGMSMGPNDTITVSDNQGTWVPACRVSFVTKGSFLGVPTTSHLNPEPTNYGNPICWFPYVDGDYTTGDNSSGGAAWDTTGKWGPMDGKLIHLSYGTCSIFETMIENVEGIWQGGVVRFPLDFDSGIMRARFNSVDGQLYVCGLKGWQTRAARRRHLSARPLHREAGVHAERVARTFARHHDRLYLPARQSRRHRRRQLRPATVELHLGRKLRLARSVAR